jgi:hypothetical protein
MANPKRRASQVSVDTTSFPNERLVALSAGDINQAIRRRIGEMLSSNRNSILTTFKQGLQELADMGAVSANESQTLNKMFRLVIDVDRDRADAEDAFLAIRTSYHELIVDQRSSAVAVAIAGVASSSFSLDKNSPLKVNKVAGAAGAIIGAAVGAGIGFGIGGPLGGAIGGVIGGAVGATVGLCGSGQT